MHLLHLNVLYSIFWKLAIPNILPYDRHVLPKFYSLHDGQRTVPSALRGAYRSSHRCFLRTSFSVKLYRRCSVSHTARELPWSPFCEISASLLSNQGSGTPPPLIEFLPGRPSWNLSLADGATVNGWDLTTERLEIFSTEATTISNCMIVLDEHRKLAIYSDTLTIFYDANSDASMTFNGTKVTFRSNSASLFLDRASEVSPPEFSSRISFNFDDNNVFEKAGAFQTPCNVDMKALVQFYPGAKIQSQCSLAFRNGTVGDVSNQILGSVSAVETLKLGPSSDRTKFWPKFDGKFVLNTFARLDIDVLSSLSLYNPLNNNNLSFVTPYTSRSSLLMTRRPVDGYKVNWPTNFPPPVQGRRYLLYRVQNLSSMGGTSEYSILDSNSDYYRFKIEYENVPDSDETSVWASWTLYDCATSSGSASSTTCGTNSSVNQPTLVLPSSSVFIINGNLTTSSIIYNGLTNLIIKGCLSLNLTSITIELTPKEIETIQSSKDGKKGMTFTILTVDDSSASCPNSPNLGRLKVDFKVKSGGCKKIKTNIVSTSKTLSATFTIDSSRCNLWWIILVSVVCGILVLAVLIIILLAVFVPSFREKIRPFSKRNARLK